MDLGLYDSYEMIYSIDFPSTESGFRDFIVELTAINEKANADNGTRRIRTVTRKAGVVLGDREIRSESVPVLLPQSP
ncbi:MAG: hypothetical protein QW100_02235 [Thermoplasmatales archaeon]